VNHDTFRHQMPSTQGWKYWSCVYTPEYSKWCSCHLVLNRWRAPLRETPRRNQNHHQTFWFS
jgi:hypothetical protein